MKKNQRVLMFVFAALFVISVALRFYQLAVLTDWSGDSGGDLLVARNILFFGHRPLVGPFLTVENIFLPPLYFYLLAGILWVVHTPIGIVGFFFIINMLLGILLGALAGRMIDFTAGVIAFALFAFSATLVEHGRSFYQPYMLEPFFVLCLYFLWMATKNKRSAYLIFSLVSFSIAAAIYPSPWLLMPYMTYLVYNYLLLRSVFHNRMHAVIGAMVLLGAGSIPIYIPWFVHELQYGLPTFMAIPKNDFGGISNILGWPQQYGIYFYQLVNQFLGIESIFSVPYSYYAAAVFVIASIVIGMQVISGIKSLSSERASVYRRAFSFVDMRWYLISFVPMIFFWENAYHRLWVYLPIIILISALVIRLTVEARSVWLKVSVGIMVMFFVAGNVAANWYRISAYPKNSLRNTQHAAAFILSEVKKRGIVNHNYTVLYYTPYGYENYNVATIIYFLQERGGYPVYFLDAGNDIDRHSINTPNTEVVYLICRSDIPSDESVAKCSNFFLVRNPKYVLDTVTVLPLGHVFIYTRRY